MSRNYKFHNPQGIYFVSFSVVEWLDVFSRNEYKNILIETFHFCQKNKGMEIYAWCIMPSHVHLIFSSSGKQEPQLLLGDYKRFTSNAIVKSIVNNPRENHRELFIETFSKAALQSSNVKKLQFWQHDNHPIELWSNKVIDEKINYIHNNPVEAGIVFRPEDYLYSSAIDYAGGKGLVDDVIIV